MSRKTRNVLSCSAIVVPTAVASAFFIAAIIAQNLWLSLALGIAGAATFAYAIFRLREMRKSSPKNKQQ
jgi:threonine/homoserine/homoserine lactone efflux protein